jgi:hypothetical protein
MTSASWVMADDTSFRRLGPQSKRPTRRFVVATVRDFLRLSVSNMSGNARKVRRSSIFLNGPVFLV